MERTLRSWKGSGIDGVVNTYMIQMKILIYKGRSWHFRCDAVFHFFIF